MTGELDDLDAYGRDYSPATTGAVADLGIRSSDRYVDARDPLRARARSGPHEAAVRLGVDPGTFFCGALLAELIHLRRQPERAGLRVGFLHVPPDHASGALARVKAALHDRATNLEMIASVVAIALRGLTPPAGGAILVTAFGSFRGVADNPTDAFVRDPPSLDRAVALAHPGAALEATQELAHGLRARSYALAAPRRLRLFTATLPLAASDDDALAGRYWPSEQVADDLHALVDAVGAPLDAILSLGVDSSQSTGPLPPTFKVETQTRGWHQGGRPGRHATSHFERDLELARIFLAARARREAPLDYDDDPPPGAEGPTHR
ncbi:MAG: hypothetical protein H6711_05045 [Myxococcales bacterium]|nr:hypothetical protein [Myxococcales bacterium]